MTEVLHSPAPYAGINAGDGDMRELTLLLRGYGAFQSVADGRCILTLNGHEHPVHTVAAGTEGSPVASGGEATRVLQWSDGTDGLLKGVYVASDSVNCALRIPAGKRVAAGDAANHIQLWDAATGAVPTALRGHAGEVDTVAFSPGGRLLASAGDDACVLLWNVATEDPWH